MELVKITELAGQLGLSSRSLRYYEQVGLIESIRPEAEKYRYYDERNIDRLKQIIVLRKMQIPIKDIIRIYESDDMSTVVEVFVGRIREIENEVDALSELKRIIGDFLQVMVKNGITKISALPLLYEEMDKQLELLEEHKPISFDDLTGLNERLAHPVQPAITSLPAMRVISSRLKNSPQISDTDGFWRWALSSGLSPGQPGRHEQFDYQSESGDIIILRVPDGFANESGFIDYRLEAGLFASINIYLDEDLSQRFRSLIQSFDDNKFYEIDYAHDGSLRHPAMLESLISPDNKRELVSLFVPVKKRMPDPALFGAAEEITDITIEEIEAANPILWEKSVPLDKLTPINRPHYKMMENGEVEYTGFISTRVLGTNVAVKLPFRVDIEFRIAGFDERFGYGDSEGSIIFYHGEDAGYFAGGHLGQMGFGINMGNHASADAWTPSPSHAESLRFRQPVFRDLYDFPGRGKIDREGYNRVTWIIGAKHLAVIVNGEIRYCGANLPYMSLDLSHEEARKIVVGSNGQGKKYFREIKVSQLAYSPKNKFKKEELVMVTKRSNNMIPNIHRLITDEYGENYWFNGCAKYVMESLGEKDFDYQFFAGLTGDVFAQHYAYGEFLSEGVSGYMQLTGNFAFIEEIFAKCGYASTIVTDNELQKNTEMYLQTLIAFIDKGVPVISLGQGPSGPPIGVYVGYEEHGKTLLFITGNSNTPTRIPIEKAVKADYEITGGWVFVGSKKENRELSQIYREAILSLPKLLTTKTERFCFGAEAFRAWARDIDGGKFDKMQPEDFDPWSCYTSYICALATNGSCCHEFLKRARQFNPDMAFLEEVSRLYKRTANMWNKDNGTDLEALGGGFNVTLEALQDKARRDKIVAKIYEIADVADEILRVLIENMASERLTCNRFEYIEIGKMRFIGVDASRTGEEWDDLWARSGEFMPALDALAADYGTDITSACSMMHHNGNDVDSENHFLAGRFFKADTPVPDGYDYFDVPTARAAFAEYTTGEYDGALGSAYFATRDRILVGGNKIPYPQSYWHAEVYINGRPHDGFYNFAYMFSIDD